jgi:hypothetical protein
VAGAGSLAALHPLPEYCLCRADPTITCYESSEAHLRSAPSFEGRAGAQFLLQRKWGRFFWGEGVMWPVLRGTGVSRAGRAGAGRLAVRSAVHSLEAVELPAVLRRSPRDQCVRCAQPIEPGLLAFAAIMCACCRGKSRRNQSVHRPQNF